MTQRRQYRTPHPGQIEVYEEGKLVKTLDATKLPDAVRYAKTKTAEVPVVRVDTRRAGNQTFVREFGLDGTLLRSTTHLAPPS